MSNSKHLSLDERNIIEQELYNNSSFKYIASPIDKDPSTISKEVRKHRIMKEGQSIHSSNNTCARRFNCKIKNLCHDKCRIFCRNCANCNEVCSESIDGTCLRLRKPPYVCNGCNHKISCRLTKYYYKALSSHKVYRTVLSDARQGINMTEYELSSLDHIISPLIRNGQSISLIKKTHDINCPRATLYKYVKNNCFSISPIDLPRMVRLRKRKIKHEKPKNTKARINRTHEFIR